MSCEHQVVVADEVDVHMPYIVTEVIFGSSDDTLISAIPAGQILPCVGINGFVVVILLEMLLHEHRVAASHEAQVTDQAWMGIILGASGNVSIQGLGLEFWLRSRFLESAPDRC